MYWVECSSTLSYSRSNSLCSQTLAALKGESPPTTPKDSDSPLSHDEFVRMLNDVKPAASCFVRKDAFASNAVQPLAARAPSDGLLEVVPAAVASFPGSVSAADVAAARQTVHEKRLETEIADLAMDFEREHGPIDVDIGLEGHATSRYDLEQGATCVANQASEQSEGEEEVFDGDASQLQELEDCEATLAAAELHIQLLRASLAPPSPDTVGLLQQEMARLEMEEELDAESPLMSSSHLRGDEYHFTVDESEVTCDGNGLGISAVARCLPLPASRFTDDPLERRRLAAESRAAVEEKARSVRVAEHAVWGNGLHLTGTLRGRDSLSNVLGMTTFRSAQESHFSQEDSQRFQSQDRAAALRKVIRQKSRLEPPCSRRCTLLFSLASISFGRRFRHWSHALCLLCRHPTGHPTALARQLPALVKHI